MEPMSAGIMVGGNLLAGLMQAEAQKRQAEEARKLEGQMIAAKSQQEALGNMSQGQQNSLAQLMSAYRSIMG